MQEIRIVPYERFGPVRFGSTEEQVTASMAGIAQFDHAREEFGFRVHFYKLDKSCFFKVVFDAEDCRSAELFPYERDCVPVVDGGLQLAGDLNEVVQAIEEHGYETRLGPDHMNDVQTQVLCDDLGIVLWHATEDIVSIESLCAFRRDVYRQAFFY